MKGQEPELSPEQIAQLSASDDKPQVKAPVELAYWQWGQIRKRNKILDEERAKAVLSAPAAGGE